MTLEMLQNEEVFFNIFLFFFLSFLYSFEGRCVRGRGEERRGGGEGLMERGGDSD